MIVDGDVAAWTVDKLHEIKRKHEAGRRFGPRGKAAGALDDMVAVGPSIKGAGQLFGTNTDGVSIIRHFAAGEPALPLDFINSFDPSRSTGPGQGITIRR